MVIDHIGIVVKSLKAGIDHWTRAFGYKQMTEMVLNTKQMVKVVFMEKENSLLVKLIEPSEEKSPINSFAMKGGGLHHICFKCENMEEQIQTFDNMKSEVRVFVKPQPGEAFDNENIAFAMSKFNVNVELIDTDKKANKIVAP